MPYTCYIVVYTCFESPMHLFSRDSELLVRVQGPRPENVLFLVHEVFEGLISESFQGVSYDYQIPCPDCLILVSMHIEDQYRSDTSMLMLRYAFMS